MMLAEGAFLTAADLFDNAGPRCGKLDAGVPFVFKENFPRQDMLAFFDNDTRAQPDIIGAGNGGVFDGFVIRIDPLIGRSGERKIKPFGDFEIFHDRTLTPLCLSERTAFQQKSAICTMSGYAGRTSPDTLFWEMAPGWGRNLWANERHNSS